MPTTIGIDTGGTFTDLVALADDGSVQVTKYPSTPDAPMQAFSNVLLKSTVEIADIERIVHGTTVATNAVIQRSGARVLLITTAGFEDIPFIQRLNRRREYDLQWLKPRPLVLRRDCIGVNERIDSEGEVIQPLIPDSLELLRQAIEERSANRSVEAIAVCLLFSYLNPDHELEIGHFLRESFPGIPVSLSCEIAPIWREYERGSTTLTDAYVKPLLVGYCAEISEALRDLGVTGPCSLLKSNGGTCGLARAPDRPVDALLSGLAGGIVGGRYFASGAGLDNAITFDMGGTSCDVGLITDGAQAFTTEFEIEWGLPVAIPVIEVRTLGAGGGSIAWIDKGGMLNVGPRSAGAVPGPACYGTGGTHPTVTDANLVLGRLNPAYFLGGELPIHCDKAMDAIQPLANSMGCPVEQAAMAIIDIADENMTNAIRLLTIERGIDPREHALVAFGGAGPLHAASIARKLGIRTILVPPHPGLCSAFGAAISQLRIEMVQTIAAREADVDDARLQAGFDAMLQKSRSEIAREGLVGEPRESLVISMRYGQQNYEQDIAYNAGDGLADAVERFHQRHHEFYGYHFEDEPIELVHLKVSVSESSPEPEIQLQSREADDGNKGTRSVIQSSALNVPTVVYDRERLKPGVRFSGPAMIEEIDSTTYVPSDIEVQVDHSNNLILTLGAETQ